MYLSVTRNITFLVGPECHFIWYISIYHDFSMTFDIFKDFTDSCRHGNHQGVLNFHSGIGVPPEGPQMGA